MAVECYLIQIQTFQGVFVELQIIIKNGVVVEHEIDNLVGFLVGLIIHNNVIRNSEQSNVYNMCKNQQKP